MTSRLHILLVLVAAILPTTACKRQAADKELPPASGAGAPARPALPDVKPEQPDKTPESAPADRTTGTTEPIDRAEVAPSMSAIISSIDVDEGDMVKKGQLLFRLRTSDLSLRVDQAQAAQKSAQVGVSASRVEFERMQRLLDKQAVEQAQYDRVKAQYDAAKVGAEQAAVAVSLARRSLGDATVKSPISGVVTKVLKNAGEMATMMPPTVVVIVEDQSRLEVHFRVPEKTLATLKVGDAVDAEFEALGGMRPATIARISPSVDPRTRTIEMIAELDNKDGQLRSGMLAVIHLKNAPPPAPAPASPPAPSKGAK